MTSAIFKEVVLHTESPRRELGEKPILVVTKVNT